MAEPELDDRQARLAALAAIMAEPDPNPNPNDRQARLAALAKSSRKAFRAHLFAVIVEALANGVADEMTVAEMLTEAHARADGQMLIVEAMELVESHAAQKSDI